MTQYFDTEQEAREWMYAEIDDECVDNYRFAYLSGDMLEYNNAQDRGCCGFFDCEVIVNGMAAMIGCNYGH